MTLLDEPTTEETPSTGIFRLERRITTVLTVIVSAGVIALMLLCIADIVLRNIGSPINLNSVEIIDVAIVPLALLGLLPALVSRVHVETGLLVDRLSPKTRSLIVAIALAICVPFLVWAVIQTTGAAIQSTGIREARYGLAQVPIWPSKISIPIGLGLFTIGLALRAGFDFKRFFELSKAEKSGEK
ncbi:MAG: TRAP transporter small permease subunit [Cryobacterium sp.]|nr:TRAP transporter small permease subunit [Cryobacterium sp.]